MKEPIARKVEGVDLDLGVLARHERSRCRGWKPSPRSRDGCQRHDREQRLRRRHDAADGVHGELLHDAVDRRGQLLKLRSARFALTRSSRSPAALRCASTRSPNRVRRYSASASARPCTMAASAASASRDLALLYLELLLRLDQGLVELRDNWLSTRWCGRTGSCEFQRVPAGPAEPPRASLIVAATVASSASFCALCRSRAASLARCSSS